MPHLAVDRHPGMRNRAIKKAFAIAQQLGIIAHHEAVGVFPAGLSTESSPTAATGYYLFDVPTFVIRERFSAHLHGLVHWHRRVTRWPWRYGFRHLSL